MKNFTCSAFFTAILICLVVPVHIRAQAQDVLADTSQNADKHSFARRIADSICADLHTPLTSKPMKWKAVVIPAALITYGSVSVATGWFNNVNLLGKDWAAGTEDPNQKTHVDDFTEYAPAVAVYGLQLGGVRGKNNVVDETFIYTMSWGLAHVVTAPLKLLSRETRPDSTDTRSFPSGHTTTAFVGAEFLRQEYKDVSPWIGAGGYAVAVLTGYLRMYNNKHWFSDVLAGAGIGILSTRVTYLLYPKMKNYFLKKHSDSRAMILPTYNNGAIGFCATYHF